MNWAEIETIAKNFSKGASIDTVVKDRGFDSVNGFVKSLRAAGCEIAILCSGSVVVVEIATGETIEY